MLDTRERFPHTSAIVRMRSAATAFPATGTVGLASLGLIALLLIAILPR